MNDKERFRDILNRYGRLNEIEEEDLLFVFNYVEQQQQEIEGLKRQFNWSMSGSAVSLEKSVESAKEWFTNQTELVEEVHELKQRVERYEKALREIKELGLFYAGTSIEHHSAAEGMYRHAEQALEEVE